MSDLARLLQQYGYGEQPNALARDGESVDTSNVLAGMPRQNALANALQTAGVPKDEHGFLFSRVGGDLKFNPYEAVKNFMSYRAPPGALSTSGDDTPVRNAADVAGWVGLSGLGLNWAGAVPANALGSAGGKLNPIRAYHGSPHNFKEFDLSKVGTGEGAQAYGHGIYVAENEATAKYYRDHLGGFNRGITIEGKRYDPVMAKDVDKLAKNADIDKEIAREILAYYDHTPEQMVAEANRWGRNERSEAIERAAEWRRQNELKTRGKMYEVAINADRDKFLDWDKPFAEQPEAVRKALSDVEIPHEARAQAARELFGTDDAWARKWSDDEVRAIEERARNNILGQQLYWALEAQLGKQGTHPNQVSQLASSTLRDKGLAGIEYLDQGSRASEAPGTKNRVIFDASMIEILRKYGLLGAIGLGASSVADDR